MLTLTDLTALGITTWILWIILIIVILYVIIWIWTFVSILSSRIPSWVKGLWVIFLFGTSLLTIILWIVFKPKAFKYSGRRKRRR